MQYSHIKIVIIFKNKEEKTMAKKEITDFGEKIGGARKDVWMKRGLCVEDTVGYDSC